MIDPNFSLFKKVLVSYNTPIVAPDLHTFIESICVVPAFGNAWSSSTAVIEREQHATKFIPSGTEFDRRKRRFNSFITRTTPRITGEAEKLQNCIGDS